MAFSLEAALVVPLALGTWLGLFAAAAPTYREVYRAARLEVMATADNLPGDSLYQTQIRQLGSAWATSLETSPQSIVELSSLVIDDWRMITRSIPGFGDVSGTKP